MDPGMWAALVQLYDNLPDYMRTFAIPLRDSHMPKLQSIPCTARFSMITVLEAPACRNLCDDNIANLKELSSLAALDASGTRLTSHGIKALAFTMHDDIGPWGLRVLDLRECAGITTDVYALLSKFPLLTVVDLRGTKCSRRIPPPPGFSVKGHPLFFHPTRLSDSLARLQEANPSMYSSPNPFTLLVNTLDHPRRPAAEGLLSHDNTVVTIANNDL
ncbi:hypothetical protein FA13DRAFT_1172334 [Coprinellus micaceus]|uniref:RNI-like protein n=1 Tax=Coprinellus micaceus TaxID=71717 RepID=A0A4Y7RBX3_COPMI|nr:hypothetical protein FA13DRAFT_1172334 [Coprinellus micaceus]